MENKTLLELNKPLARLVQSPASELKIACKAAKYLDYSQQFFGRWPNVRDSCKRLSSQLTLLWPDIRDPEQSLFVNCMRRGLIDARIAISENSHGNALNEVIEIKTFINSVADELLQCLNVTLMIKYNSGWIVYEPAIHGYLNDIMRADTNIASRMLWINKPRSVVNTRQSRLIYSSRVFDMTELNLAGLLE